MWSPSPGGKGKHFVRSVNTTPPPSPRPTSVVFLRANLCCVCVEVVGVCWGLSLSVCSLVDKRAPSPSWRCLPDPLSASFCTGCTLRCCGKCVVPPPSPPPPSDPQPVGKGATGGISLPRPSSCYQAPGVREWAGCACVYFSPAWQSLRGRGKGVQSGPSPGCAPLRTWCFLCPQRGVIAHPRRGCCCYFL